jgi:hypothetical protein
VRGLASIRPLLAFVLPGLAPAGAAPACARAAASPCASAPALSHHALLALVEPFLRRGLAPDLRGVDRMQGRIPFATTTHGRHASTLRLEARGPGRWRLVRTVHRDDGLTATLHADGTRPGALLEAVEAVPPAAQFVDGAGYAMAVSRRASPDGGEAVAVRVQARIGAALALEATTFETAGAPARVDLRPLSDDPPRLPEDTFAVLGWDWSFLRPHERGWSASVRLRGHGAERARHALRRAEAAAAHLAQVVADGPRRFHDRLRTARWLALGRRSIPTLVLAGLAIDVALAPALRADPYALSTALALGLPPGLLALFLCGSEDPRFEWPRWPRPDDGGAPRERRADPNP